MKSKLHSLLMASVWALSGLFCQANATDFKTVYAMSDNDEYGKGIYTFELGDTVRNISLFQAMTYDCVSGGLLVGDTYYYLEYQQNMQGYRTLGFYSFNIEDKTLKNIVDYGGIQDGPIISCFSYDYQTKTMYGLDSFNGGYDLVTIDLENGTIKNLGKLTYDVLNEAAKNSSVEEHMHVMTSTYDGDIYGVSYWGSLYKINQHTLKCQYIGTLDYNPGQAFMYTGDDLFYDNDTEKLYLRFTTYNWGTSQWHYEIVNIDTKTAHVTRFANVPEKSSLKAVSVPFTVASASAPAKVQNLNIKRGEKGALTATIEWDNPSKTYGRGGTLEELDYVLVFKDGVLADSIVKPVIGGHQIWTDDNITERGYFTYKIIPGNSVGRGDRASIGSYVGQGDPIGVSDLTFVPEGDNAKLTWTAPTEGTLGSYIDTKTLNYDIVRFANSEKTGTRVAQGITETSFTDETLTEMGKYTYSVVAHTTLYSSDSVKSEAAIAGPAYKLPVTFGFNSLDEFNLWTTIDANGNYSTWQWTDGMYGSVRGATCSYNYDEYPAADWLISPRIKLEEGKRYKVTFDATPGSKKVMETLAVSFGQGAEIAKQDSVTQFEIVSDKQVSLRANLPQVVATGDYNVGFLYRTNIVNYKLGISNIQVSEDHEGYIEGLVTCNGKPIEGATVIVDAGKYIATTGQDGKYTLNYLPEGRYTVKAMALGYEDIEAEATVAEYETSKCDLAMSVLPVYTVNGTVKDIAGDPVAGALVSLSGYDAKEVTTESDGGFSFSGVFKNDNYSVRITKNKLLEAVKNFSVDGNVELGTITMEDNHKPAGKVTVADNKSTATVEWNAPANDPVVQRIDDGTLTTAIGINNSTDKTMFGVVKREPATVSGVQFYIDGTPSVTHYSVQLYIFDLDEEGNPTDKILYKNTYVSASDGQWNAYTMPAPVDAPNGYYMALAYSGYLLVGIDGAGDSERWPFVKGVNCFTPDYTTGRYLYLEGQTDPRFHHNFLIRPVAAPVTVPEDDTEFQSPARRFVRANTDDGIPQPELDAKDYDGKQVFEDTPVMKTPQSRIRYNVYRMASQDIKDESRWTLLTENIQARSYEDTDWGKLAQGVYAYAVKAAYTGGILTGASVSDTVGNNMLAKVTFRIKTDTPDNEAYGTSLTMTDGVHTFKGIADDNGVITIDEAWKSHYDVTAELDGFKTYSGKIDVSVDNAYEFDCTLNENRVKPYNLVIDEGAYPDSRTFIWNYPDVFFEDFESHEDFAVNSPGKIGWQYIDGDGCETGAFSGYTWQNAGAPMAYIVFNSKATEPAMNTYFASLNPFSGDKCLMDWAAYGKANDDWIITPKLHFSKDFKFMFYAASFQNSYPETFEVAYSTTGTAPEDFTVIETVSEASEYWTQYSYDIPKEAKHVAIHCTSDQMRVFRIDDIRYGLPEALNAPVYISRSSGTVSRMLRSPSIDGLYEVYLDGEKVSQQDETSFVFENLKAGRHTAGVRANYTSGITEISTIEFSVDATGISAVTGDGFKIRIDGRTLIIDGGCDRIEMFASDGSAVKIVSKDGNNYNIGDVPAGVYIIKVYLDGKVNVIKTAIK